MKFSEFLEKKHELVTEIEAELIKIVYEDYADYFSLDEAREKIGIDKIRKEWGFGTDPVLNNRETADALGVSRVHVRNVTTHIMKKVFRSMKELRPDLSVKEIFFGIADLFKIKDEDDYKSLYLTLPNDVRTSLEKDLLKMPGAKRFIGAMKDDEDDN